MCQNGFRPLSYCIAVPNRMQAFCDQTQGIQHHAADINTAGDGFCTCSVTDFLLLTDCYTYGHEQINTQIYCLVTSTVSVFF